jgi:hypothetical protein
LKTFHKNNPSILQGRVLVLFIQPYHKSQSLDSMGSLKQFCSQVQGERQGIKSMHVYREVHGVQRPLYYFYIGLIGVKFLFKQGGVRV